MADPNNHKGHVPEGESDPNDKGPSIPMRILIHSGDSVVLFPAAALLAFAGPEDWQQPSWFALLSMALSGAVGWLVKQAVRKPRPAGEYGRGYRRYDPYAFPSGHAARCHALAAAILLTEPLTVGILSLIWAVATSWVRVYCRLHHRSDVWAGTVLGLVLTGLLHVSGLMV
ncbi:MAG: phosphatase PAP2 family protein [Chitinophagia bacterium]|nr:phosphatase PAP2 family protein [Chitinophagia bacterium]